MAKLLVSVHENQFTTDQMRQLDAVLRQNYRQHIHEVPVRVIWCTIPVGQCYTDYERSRSSFITTIISECNVNC